MVVLKQKIHGAQKKHNKNKNKKIEGPRTSAWQNTHYSGHWTFQWWIYYLVV